MEKTQKRQATLENFDNIIKRKLIFNVLSDIFYEFLLKFTFFKLVLESLESIDLDLKENLIKLSSYIAYLIN